MTARDLINRKRGHSPFPRKDFEFRGQYTAIDRLYEPKAESAGMARTARLVVPDFPHQVVQRGVRRMDVFFSSEDQHEYLSLLFQSAEKHVLEFLASCLMSNYALFVVMPRQGRLLAGTFREAHRRSTRMLNYTTGILHPDDG